MRFHTFRSMAAGAFACLATATALLSQTITGSINGNVTDQSGAVISNATVIIKNTATGIVRRSTTNAAGDYNVRFLQIDQYTVTVQEAGFADQTLGPITLEVDQIAKVNVHMAVNS